MLEEARHEVERLVDKPQAIEHHRFDGFPHREVAHFRVLVGGLVDDVTNTEFVKHASHKPEMIEDLRAVQWRLWQEVRAVRVVA